MQWVAKYRLNHNGKVFAGETVCRTREQALDWIRKDAGKASPVVQVDICKGAIVLGTWTRNGAGRLERKLK